MESTTAYNERALTSATYYWDDITHHQDIVQFFHTIVSMRFHNAHDGARYVEMCDISLANPEELKERIQFVLTGTQSRHDVVAYQDVEYGITIRDEDRIQEFAWACGDRYYLIHFSYDDDLHNRW